MSETETCQVRVSDGSRSVTFHRCGRPIKRNGMCGVHAAAEEKRAKADEERQERHHRSEAARMVAERACTKLWTIGIDAEPAYTSQPPFSFTGGIKLGPEATEQLLDQLEL